MTTSSTSAHAQVRRCLKWSCSGTLRWLVVWFHFESSRLPRVETKGCSIQPLPAPVDPRILTPCRDPTGVLKRQREYACDLKQQHCWLQNVCSTGAILQDSLCSTGRYPCVQYSSSITWCRLWQRSQSLWLRVTAETKPVESFYYRTLRRVETHVPFPMKKEFHLIKFLVTIRWQPILYFQEIL